MTRATFALLLAALFGAAFQYLFYRESLGLNVLAATALLVGAAWQVGKPRWTDLWMPAFALAFAAFIAVRAEASVLAFDVLALLALALATTAASRGVSVTRLPFAPLVSEALRTAADATWRGLLLVTAGMQPLARSVPSVGRALPYLGGIALAIPFLLLFLALFRSADAIFDRATRDLIDLTKWWDWLIEAKERTLLALVAAWLAAGALADRGPAPRASIRIGASSTALTVFIGTLVALFATFVFVQVAYLFGGGDTLAAASLTYSEYARRGFFELLFVAAFVAAILFVAELVVDRATRAYLTGALLLLALTGVVVASSVYRMNLYQRAYGWSELRLYALAAIVAVAAALAILGWSIVVRRTPHAVQPIVFVTFGIALVVNLLGPSAFITRADLLREPTPEAVRPDIWYVVSLGPGALPEIVAARAALSERDRRCLDYALVSYRASIPRLRSWQSWNLDRERGRDALAWLEANVFPSVDPRDSTVCRS